MFALHCTAKLRDRLNRSPESEKLPTSTALGDWYATALFWRPQLALLVNERTLLPVLMPLAPAATLPERFGPALAHLLRQHGIDQDFIEHEVAEMSEVAVVKTSNRSVVGTMNEFCFEATVHRERSGAADLLRLAMQLAQTPCSAIGYSTPARLLQEVVKGAPH
jgi:hypothetical protein